MKNYHRIIEQLHFINQRQAELQNELYVEQKRERHQPYYCNLDRMISGSRILWHAFTICRWPRPLLADGKSQNERRFGESFQDMLCSRVEFGKKIFWLLRLKHWKIRCIRNISQKTECERSPDNPKRCKWFSKIVKKRLRIPRTHSETGIHRKERESQRRISWR